MRTTVVFVLAVLIGSALAKPGKFSSEGSSEGGMFGFHHLPPFAQDASQQAKDELKAIMKDSSLPRTQVEQKIDDWANQQGGNVLTAYNEFKNKLPDIEKQIMQKIEASSLSDNLKSVAKQLQEVYNDKSLTLKAAADKAKSLLSSLSESDRRQIHQVLKQGQPRFKRGVMGAPGPIDRMKLPDFLGKATEEGQQAFKAILENKSLTKQQFIDQMTQWASNQGGEVKSLFDASLQKMTEMKDSIKNAIPNAPLSSEAKSALNEMLAIFENVNLTLGQEMDQRKAIMERQNEAVRSEIVNFLQQNLKM